MKTFTKVFFLILFLNSFNISAQTCNGNTFNSPGAPTTCTYTYTSSGWEDQFGNPIAAPTSTSMSESVCVLANNSNNFTVFKGTLYVATGVTYSGSISSFSDSNIVVEGILDLGTTPTIGSGTDFYIHSTGTINYPGNFDAGGDSSINNVGTFNVGGDLSLGGNTTVNNFENGSIIVQNDANISNTFNNCGLFEILTGELTAGGGSSLNNFCTTYIHQDLTLSADYLNDGLLVIDGNLNFNGSNFINNDILLSNNLVLNNDDLIGNSETSVLIVRNNAELQSGASITGHFYFDVDDGGGFDTVCGTCTEEINILSSVIIPSIPADLTADCGDNIIYHLCTDTTGSDSDGDGVYDICDLDDDNDGILDTDELGTIISTEQQPCGGDTPLDFSGAQTLLSGTDLLQGAVYRFSNITATMDAIVTIVETNNATVATLDRNVTTPKSFKPQTAFNFTNAGERGYIEYLIQFVNTGGTTPQIIDKFFMNFNDLDGGANFGEQNWADNPKTYTIDNPTEVTMNTDGTWIVATGASSDYGPSTNEFPYINFAVNYTNKSEISIRVGAVARVAGVSSAGRSHSIEFNCVTNYVSPDTYALDIDYDGLANHLDLDSDNDGILDAVESGHGQPHTNGVVNGPYGTNGLSDLVETSPGSNSINYVITDTDGIDGSNYLDIDSDNDYCFDALEGTAGYAYSDINITSGQLVSSIDANGVPGGTSQGVGTSTNDTIQAEICITGATIDFDGVNDYLSTPGFVTGLQEVTLMTWVNINSSNLGSTATIVGEDVSCRIIFSGLNTVQFEIRTDTSPTIAVSDTSFNLDEWHHITGTFNGITGEQNLYIDGNLVNSVSTAFTGTIEPTSFSNGNFEVGRHARNTGNLEYFEGSIDEVRVFDKALTQDQIGQIVYQEIENNSGNLKGKTINKDIEDFTSSENVLWTNLIAYYPMSDIISNRTLDFSNYSKNLILHNITTIQPQTAPMPYETVSDGPWTTEGTWLHGDVWDIEDVANNKDWGIVKIHHDVTTSSSHTQLGMFVDDLKTLTVGDVNLVNQDFEINNSWYLQLDGTIDLQDDSQLIQGEFSDLVTGADGKILRRQEGNLNYYWYNYWSSPVGATVATTNTNTDFSISMLKDGPEDEDTVAFTTAYNETGKISTRWLYKFQNGQTYWDWVSLTPSSLIEPGVGYTQKGISNATGEQQYIFEGKPNNGVISLIGDDVNGDNGNEHSNVSGMYNYTSTLIGNPYPSALNTTKFIADNPSVISGAIYIWEQWAGTSHNLAEYQGGYGTINMGTVAPAYQWNDPAGPDPLAKTPTTYIPVGQGFFVEVVADYGTIEFNNSQRIFKKESTGESIFFRNSDSENSTASTEDNPMGLVRLELGVSNGNKRNFVLLFGDIATDGFDYGYDARTIDPQDDDMTSFLGDEKMVIQSFAPITNDKVVDLVFNSTGTYNYTLEIIEMKNILENQEIYLRDNLTNTYFDLRSGAYSFSSDFNGEDTERFDIVFQSAETLSNEAFTNDSTLIYVNNTEDMLYVKGLTEQAKHLSITNMLGQTIKTYNNINNQTLENGISISNLSSGVYVISIQTENNLTIDKKIITN